MTVASMLGFCDGVNNEIVLLFCGKAADREQEEGRTIHRVVDGLAFQKSRCDSVRDDGNWPLGPVAGEKVGSKL